VYQRYSQNVVGSHRITTCSIGSDGGFVNHAAKITTTITTAIATALDSALSTTPRLLRAAPYPDLLTKMGSPRRAVVGLPFEVGGPPQLVHHRHRRQPPAVLTTHPAHGGDQPQLGVDGLQVARGGNPQRFASAGEKMDAVVMVSALHRRSFCWRQWTLGSSRSPVSASCYGNPGAPKTPKSDLGTSTHPPGMVGPHIE
jgi:hypothetical protein